MFIKLEQLAIEGILFNKQAMFHYFKIAECPLD
jgi:hypothetical protein